MSAEYRASRGYSRRQAVRYNEPENNALLAQDMAGAWLSDIAEFHERTANGVGSQIRRLLENKLSK